MMIGSEKINSYIDTLSKNMKSAAHLSKLEKEDNIMIGLFVKIIKPVADALDRLQAEHDSSQAFILPSLITMKHSILTLDDGTILKSMKETMLNVINKRFRA